MDVGNFMLMSLVAIISINIVVNLEHVVKLSGLFVLGIFLQTSKV